MRMRSGKRQQPTRPRKGLSRKSPLQDTSIEDAKTNQTQFTKANFEAALKKIIAKARDGKGIS
jgi:hypothetical protein